MNTTTFDPVNFTLITVLDGVFKLSAANISAKNIELSINLDHDLTVFADINMMKTVLRNLISNAVKFTPQDGTITVSAKQLLDTSIRIAVSDTGIGMSREIMDKLFRLDQKVSRPGTHGESSNGIGLILCYDLVKKLGGEILVESREGEGSTFWFTVPGRVE
jgi:signal transduction histidine kinase